MSYKAGDVVTHKLTQQRMIVLTDEAADGTFLARDTELLMFGTSRERILGEPRKVWRVEVGPSSDVNPLSRQLREEQRDDTHDERVQ